MMSKLPRILRLFSASRSPWMCRRSPPRSRSSPRPPHLCWRWVIAIMTVPINVIFHGDTSWYFLMTFHGILWWYFKMTVDDIWNFMPMATIDLAPLPHLPRCQNPRCSKPRQCTLPGNLSSNILFHSPKICSVLRKMFWFQFDITIIRLSQTNRMQLCLTECYEGSLLWFDIWQSCRKSVWRGHLWKSDF